MSKAGKTIKTIFALIGAVAIAGTAVIGTGCAISDEFKNKVTDVLNIQSNETTNPPGNTNDSGNTNNELDEYIVYLENEIVSLKSQVQELELLESEIAQLENDLISKDAELNQTKTDLDFKSAEIEKLTAEKVELEEELEIVNARIETLTSEKTQLETEILELEVEIENLKNSAGESEELNAQIAELEAQLEEKNSELANANSNIETLTTEKSNLQTQLDAKSQECAMWQYQYEELGNAYDVLEEEKSNLQTQLDSKNTELQNANTTISELQAQITALEEELENAGSEEISGYAVRVFDYDGSIIDMQYLNTGDVYTLPELPTHNDLIAQEYTSATVITNNSVTVEDYNIDIGVRYKTASGLTEFDIEVTTTSGLSISLLMDGVKNWGDGSSDSETTHTYSNYGKYTITCDGSSFSNAASQNIFNGLDICSKIRIGDAVLTLQQYMCKNLNKLETITIPNTVTSIGKECFYYCYSLKSMVYPVVNYINQSTFYGCKSLESIIIPSGVRYTSNTCFWGCRSLDYVVIPGTISSITKNSFQQCTGLKGVTLLDGITSIGQYSFDVCGLEKIVIPASVTSISSYAFQNNYHLKTVIFEASTYIDASTFRACYYIEEFKVIGNIPSFSSGSLGDVSILKFDFSNVTSVPVFTSPGLIVLAQTKIIVPDNLYNTWVTTAGWSDFASNIYKVSEVS